MTDELIWIFLLNTACSLFMTGVVWFLQIVHLSGLHHFEQEEFGHHQNRLLARAALLLVPVMAIELFSSILLTFNAPSLFLYHLGGLILVILIWLSTIFIQLPIRFKLRKSYLKEEIDRLIETNWIRTLLWSVKSLISLLGLMSLITPA